MHPIILHTMTVLSSFQDSPTTLLPGTAITSISFPSSSIHSFRFSELPPVAQLSNVFQSKPLFIWKNMFLWPWFRPGFSFKWEEKRVSPYFDDGAVGYSICAYYSTKRCNNSVVLFSYCRNTEEDTMTFRWWLMTHSSQKRGTPGDLSSCVSAPEVLKVLVCLRCHWDLFFPVPLLTVAWSQNTSIST